jgi:hypothetical protein
VGLVEFVISPPDIVRSSHQLWLLKVWMQLRRPGLVPALGDFLGEQLVGIADHLLLVDVVRDAGKARYMIRYGGARIVDYFGVSCPFGGQGRFLDEALPAAYRDTALSTFHEAVAAQEPVYTVADLRDRAGRIVHFERLLLPLSQTGTAVDGVLASIEAISPEGAMDTGGLVTAHVAPPAFAFCTIIDTREPTPGAAR